ncbi:hypothetical protein A4H97_30315 [Niastella yeongjuensis]|uniref:DUF255 domain-containing protein n=1 Tax=Niastella yeongjuensis TaxID=354355 RepID=A0A1V9EP88_9BACT|nr:hypothetical protein [Niastella yeongjuensis]OQP47901.1 hypothetical protein A4H97_30315 [Niastella yeongjuensis]SEP47900.1 hypothetical protein SAMN05660816_06659 [Niastella yeongjuensis]
MNLRLLLLIVLLPGFASAQFLPANTPLQQAFIQATQEDKLIFILIESAGCQQCNDVADKGLQSESVQLQLKANFVALRVSPFHPDLNYIKEKYNYTTDGNIVLFLDKWGTLVHRMNMSTTDSKRYVQEITTARYRYLEADKIRESEQAALAGKMDPDKLYNLMLTRKLISLPTDDLLDQYVSQLPADSLQSITTLQRIYRMSPILNSRADQVLHQNSSLYPLAWLGIPKTEQTTIRQQIIFKSRQHAIQEKQIGKAIQVADFARSESTSRSAGDRIYHYNLMEYFKGVHDTAAYLNAAVDYYDQFNMRVNTAAIKRYDSVQFAKAMKPDAPKDTLRDSQGRMILRTRTSYTAIAPRYQQDLSYGARAFYSMTNDITYLRKALQWAAHANDFYESPYALDTYARL